MKYDLLEHWTEDTAEGKVVVVNVAVRVSGNDPELARQYVKNSLDHAGLKSQQESTLKAFFDGLPPLSPSRQKMAQAGAEYIRGKLGLRVPLSDAALEELRTLMRGLPTEDGKDYILDTIVWASRNGTTLLAELDASRSSDPPADATT